MPFKTKTPHSRQRGVTLFIVIIFVMLSMLLALWASRTSLFNEMIVGNDADYQRAFEAAQALMQDAELDIQGNASDGKECLPASDSAATVCRTGSTLKFPLEAQETSILLADLGVVPLFCKDGICLKRTESQDFWNDPSVLKQMAANGIGARYGQYTGAKTGSNRNPLLESTKDTAADKGGWYWIEIMPYVDEVGNTNLMTNVSSNSLDLNLKPRVAYRITAIAYGRKSGTMSVLQQTYSRTKKKD
ncbi:pilus assembly protein PilX [Diaphorobacter sp. HDW4A]|uniref:pilus assembly PilX family protein n=1 Tax=Diaphorobacter sp. HDW4A TaxID=2714924 RepID=UPI0014078430|nr:PilX N-terminal domain-containing pilus assembly protein [Diaphorobacter sp. HDW4A]QIL78768.1 pilus assembly protein PilX [Diaphorobacter sp. HDW4A]